MSHLFYAKGAANTAERIFAVPAGRRTTMEVAIVNTNGEEGYSFKMSLFSQEDVSITSIDITDAGEGYAGIPTVSMSQSEPGLVLTPHMALDTVSAIVAGGTDYTVDDELTLTLDDGSGTDAVVKVTEVDPGGTITGLSIVSGGDMTGLGIATPASSPIALVGGTGASATINALMKVKEVVPTGDKANIGDSAEITFGGAAIRSKAAQAKPVTFVAENPNKVIESFSRSLKAEANVHVTGLILQAGQGICINRGSTDIAVNGWGVESVLAGV